MSPSTFTTVRAKFCAGAVPVSSSAADTLIVYRFIERERASHHLTTLCRLLDVSPSGYRTWAGRRPSARAQADAALVATIRAIHAASRGTYGAPRVHAELRSAGQTIGRKRVARLMRSAGMRGLAARRWKKTTSL